MRKYYTILQLFLLISLSACFGPSVPTISPLQPLPDPISWEDASIPELKKRLYSEDETYRAMAALRLVKMGKKKTFKILAKALEGNRDEVVFSILKVLTGHRDERFTEPLIEVLETKDDKFQPLILEIFYNNPDREYLVTLLLDRLYDLHKTKQPVNARKSIVLALGYIPSNNAVEPLITFLSADEDELSAEITRALKSITRQHLSTKEEWVQWWAVNKDRPREVWLDQAVNTYEKLLQDKNERIGELVSSLVSLKIEILNIRLEQAKKLDTIEDVTSLLLAALDDEHVQVKKYVLEQLRALPSDAVKAAIPRLVRMMQGTPEGIRNYVIITLGEIGNESIVDELIVFLDDAKSSIMTRKHAAEAMGKIGSFRAVSPLCNVLKEDEPQILLPAIEALGKIKDKKSVGPLLKCLEMSDKTDEVHRAIIDVLGEIKDPGCVDTIIKFTEDERDRFRWSAANSLGKIGNARAIEPLCKLLNDEFADIRQITAEALGNIGARDAAPYLVKVLLNDKDPRARELAATALGKIQDVETVPTLLQALNNPDEKVVNASWNSILALVSDRPLLMEKVAVQLEEIQQVARAAEVYRKIIGDPEFNTEEMGLRLKSAQAKLGQILVTLKSFKEAIPLLESAQKDFPDKTHYSELLLQSYEELEEWDKALAIYNGQLTKQTEGSWGWWELKQKVVDLLVRGKGYTVAIKEIKELVNQDSIIPELKDEFEVIMKECEAALKNSSPE